MSILVDLTLIGLIALFTFMGYKQGLIKAAVKIVAFFVAMMIAVSLYKPVSGLIINNTNIDENMQNSIVDRILPEGATPDQEVNIDNIITKGIMEGVSNTVNGVANMLTVKIIEGVTLLLLFIMVKIILRFITIIADWIAKIPILKQFNGIGRCSLRIFKGNNYNIFSISNFIIIFFIGRKFNNKSN